MKRLLALAALGLLLSVARAPAETTFTVRRADLTDQKAVFATVESPNVVPARSRIDGTIASLSVRQGDLVTPGQVIAVAAARALAVPLTADAAVLNGDVPATVGEQPFKRRWRFPNVTGSRCGPATASASRRISLAPNAAPRAGSC